MTGEEMERAIECLPDHHARVSSDIEKLKEALNVTAANLANDVTGDLAGQLARLAVETSRRVTALEDRSSQLGRVPQKPYDRHR